MIWKKAEHFLWSLFAVCFAVSVLCFIHLRTADPGTGEVDADADSQEVIRVLAWKDEQATFFALVEVFEAAFPEVTVELQFLPPTETEQGYLVALYNNDPVDVIATPTPASAAQLVDKGLVEPITDRIGASETNLSGLSAKITAINSTWDEEIYMLPYRGSAWVVYYNKDLFDAAGLAYPEGDWTWEEYADLAVQLSSPEDGVYGSMNYDNNSWWRVPARTKGAEMPTKAEDLKIFLETARFMYDLTYEKQAAIPFALLAGTGGNDYTARFLAGQAAMMYNGEWCLPWLNEAVETTHPDFHYDVAPLPHWEGYEGRNIGSSAVLCMPATSTHKDAAYLFMQYCCSEEGASVLASRQLLPAWDSEQTRTLFKESLSMPEHTECFFPETPVSSFPSTTEYTIAINLLNTKISEYLLQEISLETAVNEFTSELKERLGER